MRPERTSVMRSTTVRSLCMNGTAWYQTRTVGEVSASARKRFSPICSGSVVTTSGGSVFPRAMRPKYLSSSGRTAAVLKSPTSTPVWLFGA